MAKYFRPRKKFRDQFKPNLVIKVLNYDGDDYEIEVIQIDPDSSELIGTKEYYTEDDMEMLEEAFDYKAIEQFDSDLEQLLKE